MNRFMLDNKPADIAQAMCDAHVVKMILEEAQMLSTYAHEKFPQWANDNGLYKPTHRNHPATQWLFESGGNVRFAVSLFAAMAREYKHRYGREHKSWLKLRHQFMGLASGASRSPMTEHPKCMQAYPECITDDVIESYRNYYTQVKPSAMRMRWTKRQPPTWYNAGVTTHV